MSTHDRSADSAQSPAHVTLAPLVALRDTGLLDAVETALVERHVAACPICQRDAALDDALAGQLRRALLPTAQAAPALRMEEIMRATEERETNAAPTDAPETRPVVAPRAARSPSVAVRWGSGLSALAAALVLVLFATYIFGGFGPKGAVRPARVGPTPTLSPLLAQQTVYLPTDVGVYALRASDGVLRWTYPAGIETTPITHAQAINGLALDHGSLYALAAASDNPSQTGALLVALNASNGAVRWSVSIPGLGSPGILDTASLLKVGNLLIVAPRGAALPGSSQNAWTVEAFSAANGKLVWSRSLDEAPLSNLASAGGSIFIGTPRNVVALNAANGAIRWTTAIIPGGSQQGATPANFSSSVALTASGDWVQVLAKRKIIKGSATSWETNYYELAAADGSHQILWGFEDDPGGVRVFAPAPAGDLTLVPAFGGIVAFSAGPAPTTIWYFFPDGSTHRDHVMTGAAVANGVLYATDLDGALVSRDGVTTLENFTYAIRASDGAKLWRAPTNGGDTALTPVVASGLVLAPSRGVVKALRAGDGSQAWMFITPAGSAIGTPLLG